MERLLIKISGELFSHKELVKNIAKQIKILSKKHKIGLVVGGGNFFRGSIDKEKIGLKATSAHNIGMLSTIVNGIILKDLLAQTNVSSEILNAVFCPSISEKISEKSIEKAFEKNSCIIFVGGTGNPFFTTDTNAVLRSLQIGTKQIWKATKVDGVYDSDPIKNKDAKLYKNISYKEVIEKNLKVIDGTAIALAKENKISIRVFNLFEENALQKALEDKNFGSTIK